MVQCTAAETRTLSSNRNCLVVRDSGFTRKCTQSFRHNGTAKRCRSTKCVSRLKFWLGFDFQFQTAKFSFHNTSRRRRDSAESSKDFSHHPSCFDHCSWLDSSADFWVAHLHRPAQTRSHWANIHKLSRATRARQVPCELNRLLVLSFAS